MARLLRMLRDHPVMTYLRGGRCTRLRPAYLTVLVLACVYALSALVGSGSEEERGPATQPMVMEAAMGEADMAAHDIYNVVDDMNTEWADKLGYKRKVILKANSLEADAKRWSMYINNDQIDHFKAKLPPLLEGYRNPCWLEEVPDDFSYGTSYYSECALASSRAPKHSGKFREMDTVIKRRESRGENWRVRCFPSFFLLGVPKCGTQDLFNTLKLYVDEFVPGILRELHYWEYKRCGPREACHGSTRPRAPSFADYLDVYDGAAETIRKYVRLRDGQPYHPMVIGDMTPSTMSYDPCWPERPGNQNLTEPRYILAHYLFSLRPQTQFVLVIREPIERLYSSYINRNPKKYTPDTFHAEAELAVNDFKACLHKYQGSVRACAYIGHRNDFMRFMTKSIYEVFLNDWMSIFPFEQFFVLRMEDYSKNKVYWVKKLVTFLKLSPPTVEQETNIQLAQEDYLDSKTTNIMITMRNDTLQMMQTFFRPFNHRLAVLLKDQRYTWGY